MTKSIIVGLILITVNSYAQMVARTEDGKKVLLHENGTWEYAAEMTNTKASASSKLPVKRKFLHPEFKTNVNGDYYYEQKYDEFDEKTRTAVGVKIRDGFYLRFYYYTPGLILNAVPDSVVMMFVSVANSWQFGDTSDLKLSLDGERLELQKFQRLSRITPEGYREFLYKKISLSTFIKILNSDYVAGRLSQAGFVLKNEHLEAFRDFASRMK